jgi:hypothetical protein
LGISAKVSIEEKGKEERNLELIERMAEESDAFLTRYQLL